MRSFLISIFLLCLASLFSQDSLLTELLKTSTYPLELKAGKLSGPGSIQLAKAGEENAFFMVGEAHGIAELPLFTTALFRSYKSLGYKYFATETGPYTARFLEKTRRNPAWRSTLRSHFQQFPWSIPFYVWEEEWDLLDAVDAAPDSEAPTLWGIDQEFAASFRFFFQQLAREAQNTAARQLAETYFDRCSSGWEQARTTGNPSATFMMTAQPEDFSKLKAAFNNQPEQLALIKELEESITIYQLWRSDSYVSNVRRAALMKKHFLNHYQLAATQSETPPKVMFKLGSNHCSRGASTLNIFDIGNFVSEFANQQEQSSFHLLVIAQEGTQNAYTPFSKGEGDKQLAFSNSHFFNRTDCKALFTAADSVDGWKLVDLRPIRPYLFNRKLKDVPESTTKMIFGFDAVLIIPEATASTLAE